MIKKIGNFIDNFFEEGSGYILFVFVFIYLTIKTKDNLNQKIDYMFVAILFYLDYFRFHLKKKI